MDLNLRQQTIRYMKAILSTSFTQEETMEMIVPDALPDILRIVDTNANVLMRSKEAETDRVSVAGQASVTVIYCPDGVSGVRKMDVNIPFTAVSSDAGITSACKITAKAALGSISSEMINPRKILVKLELLIEIACFKEEELVLFGEQAQNDDAICVELLDADSSVNVPVGVREKTFVITDEYALPNSSPPVGEILRAGVTVSADDVKSVGNKLIFRGHAQIIVLYRPQSGGDITSAEFSSDFSQILELDQAGEDMKYDLTFMLTGVYVDKADMSQLADVRTVTAEMHIVAQCIAVSSVHFSYIADTYSNRFDLDTETDHIQFTHQENELQSREMFRDALETASTVRTVISVAVHTGLPKYGQEDGKLQIETPVFVSVLYVSDDGRLLSTSKQFASRTSIEGRPDSVFRISAECGREVYATSTGSGVDIRLAIDYNIKILSQKLITPILKIAYNQDAPLDLSDKPSLMVYRVKNGDTMWNLAKEHRSTTDLINKANSLQENDHLIIGQLLVIPKMR